MINRIKPSKRASYICEGCLFKSSILMNFTDQNNSVCLPYSSELMKLDILPKNIPTGAVTATKSKK